MKQGIERNVQTENGPLDKKKQHPHQTQMTHGGIKTVINKNENATMTARNLLRNKGKFDVRHGKVGDE